MNRSEDEEKYSFINDMLQCTNDKSFVGDQIVSAKSVSSIVYKKLIIVKCRNSCVQNIDQPQRFIQGYSSDKTILKPMSLYVACCIHCLFTVAI